MNALKSIAALTFTLMCLAKAEAQVSVNVNVGLPPVWAPAGHAEVGFYFLPEINTYYDVHAAHFIFLDRGRWIRSRHLPAHCRDYDLYHGRTVFLTDYHGRHPYYHYKQHRARYYASHYVPRRSAYARPVTLRSAHPAPAHAHNHGRGHGYGHGKHHRH